MTRHKKVRSFNQRGMSLAQSSERGSVVKKCLGLDTVQVATEIKAEMITKDKTSQLWNIQPSTEP